MKRLVVDETHPCLKQVILSKNKRFFATWGIDQNETFEIRYVNKRKGSIIVTFHYNVKRQKFGVEFRDRHMLSIGEFKQVLGLLEKCRRALPKLTRFPDNVKTWADVCQSNYDFNVINKHNSVSL